MRGGRQGYDRAVEQVIDQVFLVHTKFQLSNDDAWPMTGRKLLSTAVAQHVQ